MLTVSETVLSVSKSAKALKEERWTIQHPGPMMRDADLSRRQRHRKRDRDRQIETEMEEETYTQRDRQREGDRDGQRKAETERRVDVHAAVLWPCSSLIGTQYFSALLCHCAFNCC